MELIKGHFYSKKFSEGLYCISCTEWELPKASVNVWLIVGDKISLLLDAGIPVIGLKEYAQSLCPNNTVRLILSHGHFDHTGALFEFEDAWMSFDDKDLLYEDSIHKVHGFKGNLHPLLAGDIIELGNRKVEVISIKGHTRGSIMILDYQTNILLSGDSIARRIFYPTPDVLPINEYFDDLLKVKKLKIDKFASAHDQFLLPASQIDYIIQSIEEGIHEKHDYWKQGDDRYFTIHRGENVNDPKYLSCSFPCGSEQSIAESIKLWKQSL